ncbi:transmembrane and coiled-coil domain-containing protein 6-like [Gadus macrocephalus]|uniref:transmembrane and coiled-coil domain-containing protein 6-like n=1 Tax=Gadus macrocephalus TaxID=80720 RepID=UPI0028CB539D|nr:transmembrane and coiled-coil domain-containing protein 6-like [Gadus macrocephalus]
MGSQGGDLLPALCALARALLPSHPALALESAWVLNNLTADSSELCTALLDLNLVPELIQLLPFSQGINTMLLRVLGNVAHQTNRSCSQLARAGLVPALCATLRISEPDVVALSLEVLFMLVAGCPQVSTSTSPFRNRRSKAQQQHRLW